jgi:hypothetical protein
MKSAIFMNSKIINKKVMKRTIKLLMILMVSITITSCVQDDDYTVPNSLGNEENEKLNELLSRVDNGLANEIQLKTISEVRALAVQYEAISIVSEIMVKGYVSSSDETGNFYKEFFIQDDPTNPTATLKVVLNQADTYNQFNQGREVYIYLPGLVVGETNTGDDVITIGGKVDDFDNDVLAMTSNQIPDHLFRSTVTETLTPVELNLSEINESYIGMYVKLINVQFPLSLAGLPYVDPTDDFDSARTIESCEDSSIFEIESSTFANFKDITLPTDAKGSISGILNKTYDGYDLVLQLNTTDDVVMDDINRCDPEILECTGPSGGGSVFFEENFEGFAGYAAEGWTNVNVSGGSTSWVTGNFDGSTYAQISGFSSGDDEIDVYLITPSINMDATTGEELSFDISANYDNGTILTVLVSDDFTGDPTTATWQTLDTSIPTGPGSAFGSFAGVGPINISCVDGNVNFAFFYEGSDPSATTRYHVDNIEITGN